MMWVADKISIKLGNEKIIDKMLKLKAEDITPEKLQALREIHKVIKQDFLKKGSKRLLEILKDEFNDVDIKVKVNVAGKQKNLGALSNKFFSIIQTAMANPQGFQMAMQNPALARAFENVLEYSNIPIPDFYTLVSSAPQLSPIQPQKEVVEAETT